MEIKKCPVLVVDRPCGLELFHVSTEEPTSADPPLELWECPRGHRTHFVSKKEESKSNASDTRADDPRLGRKANGEEKTPETPPQEDQPKPPVEEPPTEQPPVEEPPPENRRKP
jgi:hypothetical protein